jgi:hypothetical protein
MECAGGGAAADIVGRHVVAGVGAEFLLCLGRYGVGEWRRRLGEFRGRRRGVLLFVLWVWEFLGLWPANGLPERTGAPFAQYVDALL